ncbi:MAG: ISL3 family transposase [Chloroflexota bacterium]|nr:ISL3 family transposase [Chloroflexota bacterium]
MLTNMLFPPDAELGVQQIQTTAAEITVLLATTAIQATCPTCQQLTTRRHSSYQRTLADLPWTTRPVRLRLWVRRFFCPNPGCPQRIFTERLPALAAPRARKTQRLTDLCRHLALAFGGEAGARLSRYLGLLTSQTTLLRLIRHVPDPPIGDPARVGIADFAFRKGQTYGTILIDLDRGTVLDLLPDRSAERVAAWFRAHPTITLITRDRAEVYAEGAKQGAPQATQVADRWHLLKNLSETVAEILTRLHTELQAALAAAAPITSLSTTNEPAVSLAVAPPLSGCLDPLPLPAPDRSPPAPPADTPIADERRAQRHRLYEDIRARHQAGQSLSQIGRDLGLMQRTVSRYARLEALPDRTRTRTGSGLAAYRAYLAARWAAGCHSELPRR